MMKNYFLYILLFFGFFVGAQKTPTVSVKVDTAKIRIGEQINYQITVDDAENGVIFPKLQLDSLGKIEIIESFNIDTLKNRLVKKYRLTSFDSGRYVIPKQPVYIWNQPYFTDSISIDVATVAVDTLKQKMYPIKAIQSEPYTFDDFKSYLWWILGILLLIGLILYFVLRKKETPEEIEARIPPYELALTRLKTLDEKQLWQKNKIKRYYVELTDIVRSYIERELKIPALESTTDELMETITDFNTSSSLNIPNETIKKLQKLLQEADLVKFAKFKPLANEIELHRNYSNLIIENIHQNIPEEVAVEKPKCPITNEEITDTITLYKWGYYIFYFSYQKITIGVSSVGKELHLREQSYFWRIVNAIGNLFVKVPIFGGTLIFIWLIITSYFLLFVAVVDFAFKGRFISRGMLYFRKGEVRTKSIENKRIKEEINQIRTNKKYGKQAKFRHKISQFLTILCFLIPFLLFGYFLVKDTYFQTENEKNKSEFINRIKKLRKEDEAVE